MLLLPHLDEMKACRWLPHDDARSILPTVYWEAHIALMRTHTTKKFSEMVFNLDEVGSADWEDREPRKVLAPATMSAGDVFHPISRRYHRVTIFTIVSAAGDALTLMVVFQASVPDD